MSIHQFEIHKDIDGSSFKVGIVKSMWNSDITNSLLNSCLKALKAHKVTEENIYSIEVPGAFELPTGAKLLAGKEKLDAIICLGCVIKGDTKHDEYISSAVASGIMMLSVSSGKPIIFGVLTTNTQEQAKERSGGKHGNKGEEAALTALTMIDLAKSLGHSKKEIGFQ
jgi:6,7-dimethyl-8-ribityllumazine synthase